MFTDAHSSRRSRAHALIYLPPTTSPLCLSLPSICRSITPKIQAETHSETLSSVRGYFLGPCSRPSVRDSPSPVPRFATDRNYAGCREHCSRYRRGFNARSPKTHPASRIYVRFIVRVCTHVCGTATQNVYASTYTHAAARDCDRRRRVKAISFSLSLSPLIPPPPPPPSSSSSPGAVISACREKRNAGYDVTASRHICVRDGNAARSCGCGCRSNCDCDDETRPYD